MSEYNRTISDLVFLTKLGERAIQIRLQNKKPIHGVRISYRRDLVCKGSAYQISESSYQKLASKLQAQ